MLSPAGIRTEKYFLTEIKNFRILLRSQVSGSLLYHELMGVFCFMAFLFLSDVSLCL